jgi:mannose/cellobiose epimerase-like protein (N-acyl-D-glucosamine 2-epimerase family)
MICRRAGQLGLVVLAFHGPIVAEPQAGFRTFKDSLEVLLTDNLMPFWYPGVVDVAHGGYRLNHDRDGRYLGAAAKEIQSQSGTLWFFARLARSPFGNEQHLAAAWHGFEFLRDHMWDREFGGFFWEIDSSAAVASKPHKEIAAQALALNALSQFIMTTSDSSALRLASELFGRLEQYGYDRSRGGYREFFRRDWGDMPPQIRSYSGQRSEDRSLRTHLHLLEAFTTYYQVTADELVRDRLLELILIQINARGDSSLTYDGDWRPLADSMKTFRAPADDLDAVWLVAEACDAVGIPVSPLVPGFSRDATRAIERSFDRDDGGFFFSVVGVGQTGRKVWWHQAEGLVATLYLYHLTGDEVYLTAFSGTLGWILRGQADRRRGGWHAVVDAQGTGEKKASARKTPFEVSRALFRALEILDILSLEETSGRS